MEPIFLEPIYKDYIWGGDNLGKLYNKDKNIKRIAESWELANNDMGISKIKGKNKTLEDLYSNKELRKKIFGTNCENVDRFPIMIKLIDAKENLSVQIHPDKIDEEKYGDYEKNEAWYILECVENSQVIYGINKKKMDRKHILKNLKYIDVKQGDVVYIKSGTVHALLGGIIAYEIQENSNSTYRIYDWKRNDPKRKLQYKKAIEFIRNKKGKIKQKNENCKSQILLNTKYFSLERLLINKRKRSNKTSFTVYTVIEGRGKVIYSNKRYNIKKVIHF